MKTQIASQKHLLSTGVAGLDDILGGGLTPDRVCVVEGEPGTGKTTTGLQFLREGAMCGESVVYITLAEAALVGVEQGMLGGNMSTTVDASYLADNVLMLRYFERDGEVKQAVSVFKKRGSLHERTIRQLSMSSRGTDVGKVLRGFRGTLTGAPVYLGGAEAPDVAPNSAGLPAAGLRSPLGAEVL